MRGVAVAPTLAVEIFSPSTAAIDRGRKRRLYARYGVPYLWFVDPIGRDLEALALSDVLARLVALPITTWQYVTQASSVRHLGPMAQDFFAAFGVGEDDKHIAAVDEMGVALAAIQGLAQVVSDKDAKIADLEARLSMLERLIKKTDRACAAKCN